VDDDIVINDFLVNLGLEREVHRNERYDRGSKYRAVDDLRGLRDARIVA
jgi:hypothetical protein